MTSTHTTGPSAGRRYLIVIGASLTVLVLGAIAYWGIVRFAPGAGSVAVIGITAVVVLALFFNWALARYAMRQASAASELETQNQRLEEQAVELELQQQQLQEQTIEMETANEDLVVTNAELEATTEELERQRAELQRERKRLAEIFRQAPAFMAVLRGPQHVFELANQAYYQVVGFRDIVGKPAAEALPEVRGQGFVDLLDSVLATGESYTGEAVRIVLRRTPDGPLEERFVNFIYQALTESDGTRSGIVALGFDVTEQVNAARATRESEARFRALVEASSQIVWTVPPDGEFVTVPTGWTELTGQSPEATAGSGWLDAVHPADRELTREAWHHAIATGEPLAIEHRLRTRNGDYRHYSVRAAPVRDEEGAVCEWVGAHTDVTERKRAEGQLIAAAETMPQLVWTTTPEGYHDYYNSRWYEYTGMSRHADHGHGWKDFLHPEDYDRTLRSWQHCLRTGEPYEIEYRFRNDRTGEYRWFLGRALPLRDESGRILKWFGTCTDIHEQKLSEEQLREARRVAEEANAAKARFLATMSHELRTPLNAIAGYVDILTMGIRGELNSNQREDLMRIKRSGKHLLSLINDILNFAKLEAGQVAFQMDDVPVDRALARLETMIEPQVLARGLSYEFHGADPFLFARADEEKLQQVLLNLLTNAIKFTDPPGKVRLSVSADDLFVRIRVRDTGHGIPEEKIASIFDPFVQLDQSLTRTREGAGLGLAISRDLARGMGGELEVEESAVGVGSTFVLTLLRGTDGAATSRDEENEDSAAA